MAASTQDLKIFRYPFKKLESNEDYLKIECLEYRPPKFDTDTYGQSNNFNLPRQDDLYRNVGTKDIRGTIILPIPENVPLNGNSVTWTDSKIGPLAAAGLGVAQKTLTGGPIAGVEALVNKFKNVIDASQTGIGQKTLQSFFAAKSVGTLLQQDLFSDVLGRNTGAVFNENVELLFRGLNLRGEFSFQFEIIPRFKKEADEVRKLIVFLKQEMAAKRGALSGDGEGLFLAAPSVFKIQYMSGNKPHPYLNRFKICAMPSLSVNFTGSNTYATYSDGTPVHMQLTLTFQELTPIYNEDYNDVQGTGY